MKKGEIRIVELPKNDGHEQYGTRPAIILSDTDDNIAMITPFTSNTRALRYPNTLTIEPNEQNGLNQESVALIFQTRAIDQKRIQNKIGELKKDKMEDIDEKLRRILNL